MQVRAMSSGSFYQPSEKAIETSRKQGKMLMASGELDQLAWPALLRMLDRKDASFRS